MRRRASVLALTLLVLVYSSYGLVAEGRPNGLKPGVDFSGPHFNLNVHGVPEGVDKFDDDTIGPGRHTIFVPVTTSGGQNVSIFYRFDYELNWTVEDCDATTDLVARIVLPAYMYLDTDQDGIEDTKTRVAYYMAYVVGLGKPTEGNMLIVPEVTYNESWTAYSFNDNGPLEVRRSKGQPQWLNATDLFFVDVEYYNFTDSTTYYYTDTWVFDVPGLLDYWWDVQNNGIKHMQIRFYPVFR